MCTLFHNASFRSALPLALHKLDSAMLASWAPGAQLAFARDSFTSSHSCTSQSSFHSPRLQYLHCPLCCNTTARLLGTIPYLPDPRVVRDTPYKIGNNNIVLTLSAQPPLMVKGSL